MRKIRAFYRPLLFATVFAACTTTHQESLLNKKAVISPPLSTINITPATLELDASKGKIFTMPNGSVISVPADCFVDSEGKPVKGKVKITYREFHDAADIILSGIPMTYDSAGVKGNFQTAGMFDIRGLQKDKSIYVAEGKNIEVKMVSYAMEHDYNFYILDEDKGNWSYTGQGTNQINEEKQKKLKELGPAPERPIEVAEASDDQFVFDLDLNVSDYPELKEFKNLMWQYAGSSDKMNPEKNQWMFNQKWTSIKFDVEDREKSTFRVVLKNKSHSFETIITPVLKGKDLEKATKKFAERVAKYNEALEARKNQEQRMKMEADLYRTFAISSFGIYNYDRYYKMPDAVKVVADFTYEGKLEGDQIQVYLVTGDGRTVIRYPQNQWELFNFLPDTKNSIVAVLPDASVATFSSEDFQKLDLNSLKSNKKHIFKLTRIKEKVKNPEDLKKIIGSIS